MSYKRQCESVTLSLIINSKCVCNNIETVPVLYLHFPVKTLKIFSNCYSFIETIFWISTRSRVTLRKIVKHTKNFSPCESISWKSQSLFTRYRHGEWLQADLKSFLRLKKIITTINAIAMDH